MIKVLEQNIEHSMPNFKRYCRARHNSHPKENALMGDKDQKLAEEVRKILVYQQGKNGTYPELWGAKIVRRFVEVLA